MKIKDRARPKLPPVEPGVYMAVCVGVVDLGEQYSENFKKYSNDVKIIWELVGEVVEIDGEIKPRHLSKDFTFSTSKKSNIRGYIASWNGKQYSDDEFADLDLFDQIGKACQVQVVLSESGEYANIDNVMALPKGMAAPTTSTAPIRWDMDTWDDEIFAKLPEWVQEKIKKSTQYQKLHTPTEEVDFKPQAAENTATATSAGCPI